MAERSYPKSRAKSGEVITAVADWVAEQEPGEEFSYTDVAEKIGQSAGSVTRVLLQLVRMPHSPLQVGHRSGWYRRTGEPVVKPSPAAAASRTQLTADVRGVGKTELEVGDVLEVVGTLKRGELLTRAADGSLWTSTRASIA